MKTDELIALLAQGAGPAPRAVAARRLAPALALGVLASAVLALALLGPIPAALWHAPAPWLKLAYATAVALAAGWLAARLGRPLPRTAAPRRALLAVLLAMAVVGAAGWALAPQPERLQGLLGHSWASCPWSVLGLSLPGLAATLWALRGLAPTRPRAAGFAAGLLAGAGGAAGYALACVELAPAFIALWYTLGIALTGALGAALGPRWLRW